MIAARLVARLFLVGKIHEGFREFWQLERARRGIFGGEVARERLFALERKVRREPRRPSLWLGGNLVSPDGMPLLTLALGVVRIGETGVVADAANGRLMVDRTA